MRERLQWYQNGELGLGRLLNDLLVLIGMLRELGHEWVREAQDAWNIADELYGVASMNPGRSMSDEERYRIHQLIQTIEELADAKWAEISDLGHSANP